VIHDWESGRPTLRRPDTIVEKVVLADCQTEAAIPLPIIDPEIGTRTLGVRIAPSGSWTTEYEFRKKPSQDLADLMAAAQFSRDMAEIAFRQVIMPAIEYPLGTVSFTSQQCDAIQRPILQVAIRKMGYPINFPRALVFGPKELGGLGIKSVWTERCIQHISTAVGHLRQPGRVGE
jgi:hypothetical protein